MKKLIGLFLVSMVGTGCVPSGGYYYHGTPHYYGHVVYGQPYVMGGVVVYGRPHYGGYWHAPSRGHGGFRGGRR
jgi:hypothetical protein